jgi:hypothetical protein
METAQVDNYLPPYLPPLESVIPDDLPDSDGEPLDSPWHRSEIQVLIESVRVHRCGRTDFFVGGNTFRGPDFFLVDAVDGIKPLRYWVVQREGGRYPDVIVELLSPTTADVDRTTKKEIYEKTFKTAEYFLYDPDTLKLEGWRHDGIKYHAIQPNEKGFLFSEKLNLWLGPWVGAYLDQTDTRLRFYDEHFQLVPLEVELIGQQLVAERRKADAERRKAKAERRKAEAERRKAEALAKSLAIEQQRVAAQQQEIARLQAVLARGKPSE